MLLVIVQHCHFLSTEILAFHMPLFFVLSGYIFKYKEDVGTNYKKINLYEYARKRFYRIMIPYFCFEFISFILALSIHHLFTFLKLGDVYMNLDFKAAIIDSITCIQTPSYMGTIPHLWFFPCIYVADIFFIILRKYLNVNILWFIAGSLLLSYGTQLLTFRLPFTIDTALLGLFFLLIGYQYKHTITSILEVNQKREIISLISLIPSILLFLYLITKSEELFLMFINRYGNYFYAIPAAILGIYIFMVLIAFLKKHELLPIKQLTFFSKNSLLLFPLHLMFLSFYSKIFEFLKINTLIQEGYFRSGIMLLLVILSVIVATPFINKYFPILTGNHIPHKYTINHEKK